MVHTLSLALTWLVLAVGCGGGVEVPIDPAGALLPEPFAEMNLPVGEGEAESTEDGGVHIAYTDGNGGDAAEQLGRYREALKRAGWKEQAEPYRMMRTIVSDFERDGRKLNLMVSGIGKRVDVQLEFE